MDITIVKAVFGSLRKTRTQPVYRDDHDLILQLVGVKGLPVHFQAHFANSEYGTAVVMMGSDGEVSIPNTLLATGLPIYCWILIEQGISGAVRYSVQIPVRQKARPDGTIPPEQADIISQAISALNDAGANAQEAADSAAQNAEYIAGVKDNLDDAIERVGVLEQAKETTLEAAGNAEAWAVGNRGGSAVPSTDPAYHNNAKYYAEQAAESARTLTIDRTLTQAGQAADAKAVGNLKTDIRNVENCLFGEPTVFTVSNNYYKSLDSALDVNKTYRFGITVSASGLYTVKTGTVASLANMYDTLFENEFFEAGIIKNVSYTPSRDALKVIRISSTSVTWSVSISELIDVDDLTTEINNKIDNKVENSEFEHVKRLQEGINLAICTIGDDLPVYSTVSGYKVVKGGSVSSASGYSVKKYAVTGDTLLYVNAVNDGEENNCVVSFRTNDGSAYDGVIEKWVDGMNQIMIVPSRATYMYISTLTTNPSIIKEVSVVVPQEIIDGSVTYPMLNNFLQGKIDLIGSVTTETGVGAFHSTSDIAECGSELLDDTGWSGEGWTGDFENGFVSSSGAEALEREIEDLVPGALYRFTITTSNAKTNGYSDFYVSLGGSAEFETYRGGGASISYTFGLVAGSEDNVLKITPSAYAGTITNLSLKKVLNAQLPALVISDTSESKTADIITGLSVLNSIYLGRSSGQKAFFGDANTAVGVNALKSVTDGFWNTAVGMNSLADNVNGTRNVAIGYIALQHCRTGDRNIAIGSFALNALTTGRGNIAIGADAVQGGNSSYSIGIGVGANGAGNTETIAIGHRAGNSSGQKNTIIGGSAMESSGNAEFCTAIGYQAGKTAVGKYDISVGAFSGYKTSGNYNIFIGYYAGYGATSGNNNIVIGNNAQKDSPTDSNTTVIGNSDTTKTKVYGDFIVQGTDGIKRKIIFNQDGTCSWEEVS